MDGEHVTYRLRSDLHRRVAVAGSVLDTGAQGVGVLHADNGAVVTHPQKDLAADGVGERHQFACERRRETLLELKRRPFSLLDEDVEVVVSHASVSDFRVAPSLSRRGPASEMSTEVFTYALPILRHYLVWALARFAHPAL